MHPECDLGKILRAREDWVRGRGRNFRLLVPFADLKLERARVPVRASGQGSLRNGCKANFEIKSLRKTNPDISWSVH